MTDRIERAVVNLGKYYGAITRDGFVSLVLNRDRSLPIGLQPPDLTTTSVIGRALLDVSEGGRTTPDLIAYINDLVKGKSDSVKSEVFKTIKICYEPMGNSDDNAKTLLSSTTPVVIGESGNRTQGVIRGQDQSGAFSLRSVIGISDRSKINSNPGAPGPDETIFSVIQVFSPRIMLSNRDMGALTLFMNAIPTIEMSRAVPFIDIIVIQQADQRGAESRNNTRINGLSLSQFLLGNKQISGEGAESVYARAKDSEIVEQDVRDPEFVDSGKIFDLSTAGMEIFTSPQTLVSADENHVESDAIADSDENSIELRTRRAAPIIDKFRPLMTLKSVSFSVVATGGMMSYKSGKISLTLHDRSRLAEVSPFVRQDRLGSTHYQIEYGWAHPSAKPHEFATDSNPENLFADLISSMRVKEKYQVTNPSLTFGDAGQIEIELPIAMLSENAAKSVNIGLDADSSTAFNEVKRLVELIDVIRSRMDTTTVTSIFGQGDVIGSLTSVNGVLGMSDDVKKALRRVQVASSQRGASANLRELGSALGSLIGQTSPTRAGSAAIAANSAVGTLSTSLKNAIQNKINKLSTTSDPFICPIDGLIERSQIEGRNPKYVSLGKILSVFVGGPVAASDYYKDFQIIFYNFNEKASYVQNMNIASMPIDIDDFKKTLESELDKLTNMPLNTFMDFMSTYFISDPGTKAYGFSTLYESNRSEDNQQRQLVNAYRDNPPGLFAKEQEILAQAYGITGLHGDLEFKMPTVNMYMESIPVRTPDGQLTSDSILRAHIFDAQCSSHITPQTLLQAANNKQIGLINTNFSTMIESRNRVASSGESPRQNGSSTQATISSESANAALGASIQTAISAGLLEPYSVASQSQSSSSQRQTATRHRLKGGFPALKRFLMSTMPSVRYGEGNSGIISAKISSIQDSANTTIAILNRGKTSDTPIGDRERGLPLQVLAIQCDMETIGCPLWGFSQQIFVDFGTGTTADSIYSVTGIEHTISQGEFKTSLKMLPIGTYASYMSLFNNIDQSISALENIDPAAFGEADQSIARAQRSAAQAARTRREAEARDRRIELLASSSARINDPNSFANPNSYNSRLGWRKVFEDDNISDTGYDSQTYSMVQNANEINDLDERIRRLDASIIRGEAELADAESDLNRSRGDTTAEDNRAKVERIKRSLQFVKTSRENLISQRSRAALRS